MIRCPNCNEELSEDLHCPNCGDIIDLSNINIDEELNKFINNNEMFNKAEETSIYSIEDLNKVLIGEVDASEIIEKTNKQLKKNEQKEEKTEDAKIYETSVSFSASINGVKKTDEEEILISNNSDSNENELSDKEELNKIFYDMENLESKYDKKIDEVLEDNKNYDTLNPNRKYNKEENNFKMLSQLEEYKNNLERYEKTTIDRQITNFLKEIDSQVDHKNNNSLSETYLSLNFTSTDKFTAIISDQNEKFDEDNEKNNKSYNNNTFVNVLDDEIIKETQTISDIDLHATIDKSDIRKEELNENLEKEAKLNIHNKYIDSREKLVNTLKVTAFITLCLCGFFFASFIFDLDYFKISPKIYLPGIIENYDTKIYSVALKDIDLAQKVQEAFEQYEEGIISYNTMVDICDKAIETVDEEIVIYDKEVYPEAEQYLFRASGIHFYTSYYIDNIKDYVKTGDDYYLNLNEKSTGIVDTILDDMERERKIFLKSLGYDDDAIKILNKKAEAEITEAKYEQ